MAPRAHVGRRRLDSDQHAAQTDSEVFQYVSLFFQVQQPVEFLGVTDRDHHHGDDQNRGHTHQESENTGLVTLFFCHGAHQKGLEIVTLP